MRDDLISPSKLLLFPSTVKKTGKAATIIVNDPEIESWRILDVEV